MEFYDVIKTRCSVRKFLKKAIPDVVDDYNSNDWEDWFVNCVDAGVYTIGIYGYGAVGEDLTPGQDNIVNFFEDKYL